MKQHALYKVPRDPGHLSGYLWKPTLVGFLLLLVSNVLATQFVAYRFRYQRALGPPLTTTFLVLAANLSYPGDPPPPKPWEAVSTAFAQISDPNNPAPEFQVAKCVQQRALASNRQVIVFPESMVPKWTDATELLWRRTLDQARLSRKTLLIGVGLPLTGTSYYRNAVLVVHNGVPIPALQRIPVPLIMWNPLNMRQSAALRLWSSGVLEINGERAALLICYEQLLTWPILESAVQHPTLLVGLANDNWARGTPSCATSGCSRLGTALPAPQHPRGESMIGDYKVDTASLASRDFPCEVGWWQVEETISW
jgi:apolipoprotein N-acyltransferase